MTVTPAGTALAESAPDLLDLWTTAMRETRAASNAARALRIGFVASTSNEATQDIVAAWGIPCFEPCDLPNCLRCWSWLTAPVFGGAGMRG